MKNAANVAEGLDRGINPRSQQTMNIKVALRTRPLMPNFGVEILDVNVVTAGPEILDAVVDCFHRNGAIVLRGQTLSKVQQLAFTRLFGEPEANARPEFCDPEFPEIYVISNKIVNGKQIGDPRPGLGWHTDFSYGRNPALCTLLHALEVPPVGSDTLFTDLCAVWDALPPERQEELDGLVIHHSFAQLMHLRGLKLSREQKAAYPDVFHPMVRRHPKDGRKALWVSTGTVKGVLDLPNPDGIKLVEDLVQFAVQERFIYRHKWQVGDLLMWDNRCTLHRGTEFDFDNHFRHVHRTWVTGEVPA